MSPFQIDIRANGPQTTPRKLAFLPSSPLGLFGSHWQQLPGYSWVKSRRQLTLPRQTRARIPNGRRELAFGHREEHRPSGFHRGRSRPSSRPRFRVPILSLDLLNWLRCLLQFRSLARFSGTFRTTETGGRPGCKHKMSLECLAIRWHKS